MGRVLKIHVMGEDSRAFRTVELINWTGQGFIGSRQHLSEVRDREELSQPAVYLLLSDENEDGGSLTSFYVGETDNFIDRITQHAQTKNWWDTFVVFVSKDQNLTKAHVRYLERELFLLAKKSIGTLNIKNTMEPGGTKLPESDVSSMKEYLGNMRFVLETLGLSYFPSQTNQPSSSKSETKKQIIHSNVLSETVFTVSLPKDLGLQNGAHYSGRMQIINGSFVLKEGSYIRKDSGEAFDKHNYFDLWKQVLSSDAVTNSNNSKLCITLKDIEFKSPSAAAAVVRARATNGRTEWKRETDGKSLVECENEQIKAI